VDRTKYVYTTNMNNLRLALFASSIGISALALAAACSSDPATPSPTTDGGTTTTDAAADTNTQPVADSGADTAVTVDAATDDAACAPFTGALPGDAGAECHDLVSSAPSVTTIADPGTLPVGTGGTLGDGLYYLTEARVFPGSPVAAGTALKYAVLVAGELSYVVDDNGPKTVRRITKKNPDGGAGIVVCETKADNNASAGTQTATCNSFMSYDSKSLFSTKFVKQ